MQKLKKPRKKPLLRRKQKLMPRLLKKKQPKRQKTKRLPQPLLRRQKRSLLLRKKPRSKKNFNVSNNVLNPLISRS